MDLEGEGFLENRGLPQVVNKAVSRGDFEWPEQFPRRSESVLLISSISGCRWSYDFQILCCQVL